MITLIMGSQTDWETMKTGYEKLQAFGVATEVKILSAHRSPEALAAYVKEAEKRGTKLFIAAAGLNAALAGFIAAHTLRPVISVPIVSGELNGVDAWIASNQMPAGVPVATMTIGKPGAINAALFAVQLLALDNPSLDAQWQQFKRRLQDES